MKNFLRDFIFHRLKYGSGFRKRLSLIESYQRLSESELLIKENSMLVEHLRNAYNNSPFYKELYDSHGVNLGQVQSKEDLSKLPVVTKELIRDRVDNIYIGNRFKHTAYTSGTSGTPLKIYYSWDCVLNEASYNEIFRNNAGHYFGDKVISLRGALDGKKKEYYDRFNKTLFLSSYHITPDNAEWYSKKINEFKPKTILGYPSSLEALSIILSEHKIKIPIAFTSSETLYPHQQELIENSLGCKIYDRYGNAERTISLVQEKHKGDYSLPKLYSINEFKKNNEIFTTNLINPQFPLIRYKVEDEIIVSESNTVKRIGGRIDDCLITPDHRRIGSAAMSLAFKKVPNIKMSQIEQDFKNKIIVNIVPGDNYSIEDTNFLEKELKKRIGEDMIIEIRKVSRSEIKKTKANKFKLIINSMEAPIGTSYGD
jgi:phenylacetate-CoA ligase